METINKYAKWQKHYLREAIKDLGENEFWNEENKDVAMGKAPLVWLESVLVDLENQLD